MDIDDLCSRARDARSLLIELLGDGSEEVADYVIGSFDDADDAGEAVELAVELLGAHLDDSSPDDLQKVAARVANLVSAGLTAAKAEVSVAAPMAALALAPASPPPQAKTLNPAPVQDHAVADPNGGSSSANTGASSQMTVMLQEMVPHASRSLCEYALRSCNFEMEAAVEMLLTAEVEALEATAAEAANARETAQREAAMSERRNEQNARRRALQRNENVRDYAADGIEPPKFEVRLPYAATRKEALRGVSTKYLDGQAISVKNGEKHVVVNQKEDWDGGSTGKVYTKGKRGKGYV